MSNIQTPGTWFKKGPSYAGRADVASLTGEQIVQLQSLLKNAGFYTGPVDGQTVGLSLLGALGNFQQAGGYGPTSRTITPEMWYGMNVLSDAVVNRRPNLDIGVWNTLQGARQTLGITTIPDPVEWSAVPPGGIGAPPGAIQQGPAQTPAPAAPLPPANTTPATIPGANTPTTQGPLDFTDAYASMDRFLTQYGLGAGSEFDLRDWARNWLKQPNYNEDVFINALQETDAFKTRFGALNDQRRGAGLPMLTPAEILEYEQTAQSIMRAAAMPAGFYDNWRDYQDLMANGVSPDELAQRVDGYRQLAYNLPPEVRQVFADWFGPGDVGAVAAYFADPDKALPIIQRQLTMAEISGAGNIMGIDVGQGTAGQLADLGIDFREAQQGFQRLDQIRGAFTESVGERQDLTIEGEGIAATFGTGPGAQGALERRIAGRQKALQGGGGAAVSQRGVIGAGRAV